VTDSGTPPDGGERAAATRLRAAAARGAGQPQPKQSANTKLQSVAPPRPTNGTGASALAAAAPRQPAVNAATAVRTSAAAQPSPTRVTAVRSAEQPQSKQPQSKLSANTKPQSVAPLRPTNGTGASALAAAAPRQPAANAVTAVRASAAVQPSPVRAATSQSKPLSGTDAPNPPLPERAVNGQGSAPASTKSSAKLSDPKQVSPRSPRQALEPDRVEMPSTKRRSARARHPVVIAGNAVMSLFLILAIAAGYFFFVGKQRFEAPGPLQQDIVINVPHGSGLRDISDLLTREGVIDQPWVFIGGVLLLKAREGLKAGEYQFKAHASVSDVVTVMSKGEVVIHQITVPEGLTSEQIVARLMDNDVLTGNIDDVPAEGSMLPDTYSFTRGETREQLIQHMQRAQQRLVQEIWAGRAPDLPLKTPEQLVILASLIEKETGKPDERTRIAAVFVNRLKKNMRLQSDPTIIYGLVGGKGTLGRPIMKSEIDQPTPYNTYQIDGLPPGPITNPGRASLEAAAIPARTRDLYFVADGTGGHVFAETYEQHQKNVLRLRKLEEGQKDQNSADDDPSAAPTQATSAPVAGQPSPRRKYNRHIHTTQ
jgi:UPF0755 protein